MTRRVGLTVLAAGLGLALFLGCFLAACGAAGEEPGPPPGLSKNGRILWQFEALLHDTFGQRDVCSSGGSRQNFTGGDVAAGACAPLAVYSPYFYVFADAHGSVFHINAKKEVGGFGNYPVAVLIRGRPVACNARETQFLILYVDTLFTLACSGAGYVIP